jgi:hypothetical protein
LKSPATRAVDSQKDLLLLRRVARPEERFEIGPRKTAVATEQRQDFLPVKQGVDGFQRPILIEHDPVAKESGLVKDNAVVV